MQYTDLPAAGVAAVAITVVFEADAAAAMGLQSAAAAVGVQAAAAVVEVHL